MVPMLIVTPRSFRIERKYGVFSKLDACTFVVNVYNDGNVLSIVTDCSPHATHVAGIATAFHPKVQIYNFIHIEQYSYEE